MLDYSSGVLEVSSDSGISCGSVSSSSSLDDDVYDTKKASKPKKIRNVRKSEVHKCVVCGDRPTGYHYDVLSCNGCKTFFRRTIITRRRFVCLRDGKCETSKDCRLSCRACRFIKCVDVGMNPKAIQFDGRGSTDSTEGMGDDEMTVVPMNRGINHEDLDQMKSLDMILHREAAVQTLREDDFPFVIYPDFTLEKLLPIHTALGRKKYHESKKKSTTVEMYTKDPVKFWTVVDLFLTVEFAKTFTEFQTLTSKDRKELMSNVGGPIQMFSQSFYSIKQQSDAIIYPDGMNSINYIFTAMESGPRHEYYYRQNYCRPVDLVRRLDLTTEEFVMLKTIFLFSNETDLADEAKMVISKKREILVALFRKHLLRRYGLASGTEKLAKCLLAVSTFIEVFEKRRTYCYWLDLTKEMEFATLVRSIYLKDAS